MRLLFIGTFMLCKLLSHAQQNETLQDSGTLSLKQIIINPSNFLLKPAMIAPNYYQQQLGYFCKQEIVLQKVLFVPIKFRLGTQQQCDRIEVK